MLIGNHLGTSFEIWSGRQTWFWFVVDCRCDGAAIGAAANEVEAIREACLSIEEMAARRSHTAESPRINKSEVQIANAFQPAREIPAGLTCKLSWSAISLDGAVNAFEECESAAMSPSPHLYIRALTSDRKRKR
jgi:hypothetical protein